MFKISFPLPYYIPIKAGEQYVTSYPDFFSFKLSFEVFKNEVAKSKSEIEEYCTFIHLEVLPMFNVDELDEKELTRRVVKNSIVYINNFIDSLRLTLNLNHIKNFSIFDLPPITIVRINSKEIGYVTTPTVMINSIEPAGIELVGETLSKMGTWRVHPYIEVCDKFLSKAMHHLFTEEFVFAIVELQTSFEAYCRLCLHLILEANSADDTAIQRAKNMPLRNLIEHHLGKALNENLSFDTNTVMLKWRNSLYKLRNEIVHDGKSYISGEEAYEAYDSLETFTQYLTGLMIDAGYMDSQGLFQVKALNKNTPETVDGDLVIKKLKERGFL